MFSDRLEDSVRRNDPTVPSGMDVFETFLVMDNGRVFMLNEHLDRMKRSIRELELGDEPDIENLGKQIEGMTEKDEYRNRVIRLEYSAGAGGAPRFSVNVRNHQEPIETECPVRLVIADVRRNPRSYVVYHKTGNYMENRIAHNKAKKRGFDDTLFLNTDGFIAETAVSNIFLVKDNTLLTPSVECGILPGIVRSWVLSHVIQNDLIVIQMSLDVGELREADEVFVTNSVIGIRSVSEIIGAEGSVFSSSGQTPVTNRIRRSFMEALQSSKEQTDGE
jgi:branched-subunit amino acid aminotransferase/4-amino-4-deoxychorismate lyase